MPRDLQELSELGVPLYSELGVHGGYQVLSERTLPPIVLSESEATALFFACQSLHNCRSLPFEAESRTALNKFYYHLPQDLKTRIDRFKDKLLFWVPPHDYDIPWLPELLRAALDRQTVTAIYASERGTKRRTIHPVGLYSMNGVWYCPAIDDETGKLSTFRAERFQQVEISVEHSGKYSKRLAALSVAGCIFPEEAEAEDMALEVRMTSKGVLKCRSDLWLASRLTVNEDGSGKIMCSMKASFVQWAASFFLSLGKDAVVVQPEEVRQAIKDHIAETLPNYM